MTDRGLKIILYAIYHQPSPIPFQCAEQTFEEEDGRIVRLSVEEGVCQIRHGPATDSPPAPQEEVTLDIVVLDCEITTECTDEALRHQTTTIAKHLYQAVPGLYDRAVTHMKLHFVIRGGFLELLADSECTTSTQSLMKNDPDLERRFAEFYTEESQVVFTRDACCCNLPDCTDPHYKIPLTLVMLYKVEQRFKTANPGQLLTLVLFRVPADKFAYACVRCWHNISTAEFLAHCSRRDMPVLRTFPPKPFQPLSDSELFEKGKFPVGLSQRMNAPHSFVLNLVHSPYRAPPSWPKKPTIATHPPIESLESWGSQPSWVKRQMSWDRTGTRPRTVTLSRGYPGSDLSRPAVPVIAQPPAAAGRVSKIYAPRPFDVSYLDVRRKRLLHSGNTDFCTRFSLEHWMV
jgi:hypothetical protein